MVSSSMCSNSNENNNNDDDVTATAVKAAAAAVAVHPKILRDTQDIKTSLEKYHPVLIEGPGISDKRNATPIANRIINNLQQRIQSQKITKPILLISQGDPIKKDDPSSGIATIFKMVYDNCPTGGTTITKCLVCIDEHIYDWHARDADRTDVIYEMRYSQMVQIVADHDVTLPSKIEEAINNRIQRLNVLREKEGKRILQSWYLDFALLQEMTKVAMKIVSGDVTIIHTMSKSNIDQYTVTSFYQIGFNLGLIDASHMIFYNEENHETITK